MSDKGSKTKSVEYNPLDITKPEETPTELAKPLEPLSSGEKDQGLEPKAGWLEPQLNTNWSIEPAATEVPQPLWHMDAGKPAQPEPSGFEGTETPSQPDIHPQWKELQEQSEQDPDQSAEQAIQPLLPIIEDPQVPTPFDQQEQHFIDEQLIPPSEEQELNTFHEVSNVGLPKATSDLPNINSPAATKTELPKIELPDVDPPEPKTKTGTGGFQTFTELPPVHFMPEEIANEPATSPSIKISGDEFDEKTGKRESSIKLENPQKEITREFKLGDAIQNQLDLLQKQIRPIETTNADKKLNDNQQEVLRKYAALKEAENRDLMDQKRHYQALIEKLETESKSLNLQNQVITTELELLKTREESTRRDLLALKEKYQEELRRQKVDYEQKLLESSKGTSMASELEQKKEQWKAKIKEELNRIKLKERELENKYELLKRDTEALLDSKDQHVLELKRKNDALELEMDALEEKLRTANTLLSQMDSKRQRLMETFRLASALLEKLDKPDPS